MWSANEFFGPFFSDIDPTEQQITVAARSVRKHATNELVRELERLACLNHRNAILLLGIIAYKNIEFPEFETGKKAAIDHFYKLYTLGSQLGLYYYLWCRSDRAAMEKLATPKNPAAIYALAEHTKDPVFMRLAEKLGFTLFQKDYAQEGNVTVTVPLPKDFEILDCNASDSFLNALVRNGILKEKPVCCNRYMFRIVKCTKCEHFELFCDTRLHDKETLTKASAVVAMVDHSSTHAESKPFRDIVESNISEGRKLCKKWPGVDQNSVCKLLGMIRDEFEEFYNGTGPRPTVLLQEALEDFRKIINAQNLVDLFNMWADATGNNLISL